MSEYLNYGALSVLGFITIVIFIVDYNNQKEKSIGVYILLSICFGLLFFEANNSHITVLKNTSDFKNKNATLKCASGGGLYSSADTYKVSLDDGWKVDKDYFIKESFMVRADNCERW